MIIEKVKSAEYDRVKAFYYAVIDGFEGMPYHPCWEKDIYPAPEQLKDLIEKGEMFVGTEDNEIICVMALNHDNNESYDNFDWPTKASKDDVYVIHMLATLPKYGKQGKAKEMVRYAIEKAKKENCKVIRLDVLKGNLPANKLYESFDFVKLATVPMYYPDTGWTDFELYELALQEGL